jgi:hypothetical protein
VAAIADGDAGHRALGGGLGVGYYISNIIYIYLYRESNKSRLINLLRRLRLQDSVLRAITRCWRQSETHCSNICRLSSSTINLHTTSRRTISPRSDRNVE